MPLKLSKNSNHSQGFLQHELNNSRSNIKKAALMARELVDVGGAGQKLGKREPEQGAELPPTVGMSEADFLCTRAGVAGVEKINRTTTVGGERKQYVMRESSRGTRYVYTE